ncbi:hypothetical protein [Gottfriedia acidiceleris]|uniref:DUF3862 domain-containing protein n=1 Tax=Gottfriedia acidiceleris TaxID=371036 RepID=A0ABY4JIF5_9BACI|nr:hypothetical protein [Gottfriedia acidiceleris]UPM52613.1 hypothetical protein MY490_12275 [Gottfriedia acidiceleris]
MKKYSHLILSVVLSAIILVGCGIGHKEKSSSYSIAAIVYHTLSDKDKAELVNDKPDGGGVVERKVVTKEIAHLTDESYDGKEVYSVTFHTKNSEILGDIIVFFDGETQKVIGRGYRE